MVFSKNPRRAGILTASFFAAFLFFTACEQPLNPNNGLDKDATLRTLSVDKGTLSPVFSASHFEYSVTVRNDVDSITVTATANSGKAIVNGADPKSLAEGSNSIPVVVNAESGDSKTYTITVTRLDSSFAGTGIETAEDMAKIGVAGTHPLSGDYLLMNDITLTNWKPVGSAATPFSGSFNGNGKKITLASFSSATISDTAAAIDYIGIFGYVKGASASAKAEIKNLTVNSTVNQSLTRARSSSVGLVASRAETAAVIENITLTGTLTLDSTHRLHLGGAIGIINGADVVVKNCISSLNMNIIPGGSGVGSGSSLAPATGDIYVGGIVGYFNNGAGIENCHVTGNITADNLASPTTGNGQVYVGGITGGSEYNFSTTYKGYIKDSSFTGTLSGRAKGSWTFAGGIAGTIVGGTVNDLNQTTRIERCFAKGTVSVEGTNSPYPYVGGIVGYNYYGALVSQSYFDGNVICINRASGNFTQDYTGGIAGYNSQTTGVNNSRIEDCWSAGKVIGTTNAAGIVGQNQVNTYLRRCYSRMVIENRGNAGNWGVGGITGLNSALMVEACVALNPSITTATGNNIHCVTGTTSDTRSNNYAWSGMAVTTGGTYTAEKGVTAADGADCIEKPAQSFYTGIGWNFTTVWIMGSNGYPKLRWQ
jgi:hypothetical protein